MKNKHLLQADKDPPCVLVNVFREKANGQSWPWCPFARRQCGRERKQVLHFAEDLCAARAATTLPDEIIQHLYPVWTQTISNPTSHVAALTRFQNAPVLEPTNKPDSRLHVSFQNVCLTDAWEHHVVERQFKPIFGSKTYQWEGTREKKWKKNCTDSLQLLPSRSKARNALNKQTPPVLCEDQNRSPLQPWALARFCNLISLVKGQQWRIGKNGTANERKWVNQSHEL